MLNAVLLFAVSDPKMLAALVLVAVACGALGFAFRGAIRKEIARAAEEGKSFEAKLESWAGRLEQGGMSEARAVAAEIRSLLNRIAARL